MLPHLYIIAMTAVAVAGAAVVTWAICRAHRDAYYWRLPRAPRGATYTRDQLLAGVV